MPKGEVTSLPNDIRGLSFRAGEGDSFKVLEALYFATEDISSQHRSHLSALRQGVLVSAAFFGHPVPLIVVAGGVAKLTKIEIQGGEVEGARSISQALGVTRTRSPLPLTWA